MNSNKVTLNYSNIFSLIALFLILALNVSAEKISSLSTLKNELSNCRDEVLACIKLESNKKANCFYDLSSSETCKNYKIKNLSLKRFLLEPDKGSSASKYNYKARVDTNFITNINCLNNFDQKLTGYLMSSEALIESQIIELNNILDKCKLKLSEEFLRN